MAAADEEHVPNDREPEDAGAPPGGRLARVRYMRYLPAVNADGTLRIHAEPVTVPLTVAFELGWRGGDGVALEQWQPTALAAAAAPAMPDAPAYDEAADADAAPAAPAAAARGAVAGDFTYDLSSPDAIRETLRGMENAIAVEQDEDTAEGLARDVCTLERALQQLHNEWVIDHDERDPAELVAPVNELLTDTTCVWAPNMRRVVAADNHLVRSVLESCISFIASIEAGLQDGRIARTTQRAHRGAHIDTVTGAISVYEDMKPYQVDLDQLLAQQGAARSNFRVFLARGVDLDAVEGVTMHRTIDNGHHVTEVRIERYDAVRHVLLCFSRAVDELSELGETPRVLQMAHSVLNALRALRAVVHMIRQACAPSVRRIDQLRVAVRKLQAKLAQAQMVAPLRRTPQSVSVVDLCRAWPRAANAAHVAAFRVAQQAAGRRGIPFTAATLALTPALEARSRPVDCDDLVVEGLHLQRAMMARAAVNAATGRIRARQLVDTLLHPVYPLHFEHLEELCLADKAIDWALLRTLSPLFGRLPMLKHLDLCGNPLTGAGMAALADCLIALPPEGGTPVLEILSVRGVGLGGEHIHLFATALQRLQRLHTLHCGDQPLDAHECEAFFAALATLPSLGMLELAHSNLNAAGIRVLQQQVFQGQRESLVELVLNNNPLGDDGCGVLADVLPRTPNLSALRLGNIGMGHDGMHTLSNALHATPRLSFLDLNANTVGDVGAASLARALPQLRDVSIVDLRGCDISGHMLENIRAALPPGCQLYHA